MKRRKLLSIRGLKTYYFVDGGTVKALDGVDLDIGRGEVVGLVGESGSGKSTVALSIMRLIREPGKIVGGDIIFKNKNLLKLSETEMSKIRGKEIAICFQDPYSYLNPLKKIGEQIAEVIRLHQHLSKKEARKKTLELLQFMRISSPEIVADYFPHQISGGMRQRVCIAIALSCDPSLIILDEPTSSLDVTVQAQILGLLKKIKKEMDCAMLFITHDLGIIADICDRVYVLYAGKNVEEAEVFEFFENPLHPYSRGLLKSTLSIEEFRKKLETMPGFVPNGINLPKGCYFSPRCAKAMSICRERDPPRTRHNPDHYVYCWLYGRGSN